MISYFDSSSIVKWFFDETNSETARKAKDSSSLAFTSMISLPEVMSAFNRAFLESRCTKPELEQIRNEFLRIWVKFQKIKVSEDLIRHSGQLVFTHNLRGFDSIHLASALVIDNNSRETIFFSCFDDRLNRAARSEGMQIHY